ncbi:MAG: hypothetical protein Q9168_005451 [Polycauliona sp. 1 TL-2023]
MLSSIARRCTTPGSAARLSRRVHLLAPTQPLNEEFLERYIPGLYHPVKLGDTFNHRYKIERKLGWGLQSTVWLAKDTSIEKYVALKILIAVASEDQKESTSQPITYEAKILEHINNIESDHPGRKHVAKLVDRFDHAGPHGIHRCLIFDVLSRDLDGFSHVKSTNILHGLSREYPELQQWDWIQNYFDNIPPPTGIAYESFDHVQTKPIYMPVTDASMIDIQLADLGSACWEEKRLSDKIQPEFLRAPEVSFGMPWSFGVDIWSAGITVYRLPDA